MHRAHARYAAAAAAAADSEDAIVRRHAPLVERCARRLASRTAGAVAPEDLWSAGAVGLLDAWRRFDAARDVGFEAFAEHRIKGAMLDELRALDHLPRRLRGDLDRVEKARARLAQERGREPESQEVAEAVGVPLEELHAMQALAMPHVDLDATAGLASGAAGLDDAVMRRQTLELVSRAVERLPERLQLVLSLHYVEGLTYREIAKILAVSEPRVCQLHGEAMKQLRAGVEEAG